MTGKVVDIKRFAVHDGDGIRTTVFLKGCSLRCVWCHNPEGLSFSTELGFYSQKCIGCGECLNICQSGAHSVKEGLHIFDRKACMRCGRCAEACLGEAMKLYGRDMTVEELMPILLEDRDFYQNSGGGITVSGGECLLQADFVAALLKECKAQGLSTAVDTCGFVNREAFDKVIPYTDVFLYDIKAINSDIHIKYTGQPNGLILDNLRYIDRMGKKLEIRVPYVSEYNSGEIEKIAELLCELKNVTRVRVLPYHNYAGSKYSALGIKNTLPGIIPKEDEVKAAEELLNKALERGA